MRKHKTPTTLVRVSVAAKEKMNKAAMPVADLVDDLLGIPRRKTVRLPGDKMPRKNRLRMIPEPMEEELEACIHPAGNVKEGVCFTCGEKVDKKGPAGFIGKSYISVERLDVNTVKDE